MVLGLAQMSSGEEEDRHLENTNLVAANSKFEFSSKACLKLLSLGRFDNCI